MCGCREDNSKISVFVFLSQIVTSASPPTPVDRSKEVVMRCILLGKGPVTSQYTLRNNFSKLRNITREEFTEPAEYLQSLQLGVLVDISTTKGSRPTPVFIKKHPHEAENILRMNSGRGLCTPQEYTEKFHMRVSTVISLRQRAQLVTMGLVSEKQLK